MKNWSLSQKIWSILGLLAFAFIGNTFFSLNSLMHVRDNLNDVTGNVVRRDQLTSEIKDNQRRVSVITMEAILHSDDHKLQENKKTFEEILEKQEKDTAEYESLASEKGKAILSRYTDAYKKYLEGCYKSREFAFKQMDKEASEAYLATTPELQVMRKEISALNELTAEQLKDKSELANAEVQQSLMMGIIVSCLAIFISLTIAFFVLRSLTRAINEVVKNLFENSVQVSSAASQIASSSEELSQAATEQAASLEETAAAIEEMSSMVQKNSGNAEETASTSTKSQESASQGKVIVEKMIQSMDAINHSNTAIMDQVNESNASVAGIVKVIEEIESKTKVINDIVFQTKLLSFNASVEAARAGEHGKGFAVVAEEVGNLAQMSGNAAKEISSLLGESVQKVNQIVQETQSKVEKLISEGKETVEQGAEVARQCGSVLEEIVHSVSSVSSMSGEIATASQEQARGVTEITKAMGQLDQMTQQNAATSEECASAAEELSAQSESLKSTVNQLVATVSGAKNSQLGSEIPSVPSASRMKSAKNVIQFKPESKGQVPMKKAAGDTPTYHNDGFEDS